MKRLLRNSLLIFVLVMSLLLTAVFAEQEGTLLLDKMQFMGSYGNAMVITEEKNKEIVQYIRSTAKSDFVGGIYAEFDLDEFMGPYFSELIYTADDIKGYDKLVFDVCSVSQEKFGDLEALINWDMYKEYLEDTYPNFESFKKDFGFSKAVSDQFSITDVQKDGYPKTDAAIKIEIFDGQGNYKYVVTPSNEWERVELDISDMEGIKISFSISNTAAVLVDNPRVIKAGAVKEASSIKAEPTSSKVYVNGEAIEFDAYKINNNNYFKLRDLAYVLSGTEKQFEVKWDAQVKAIELISNMPYTEVGGELSKGDGEEKMAEKTTAAIYVDGVKTDLDAYKINSNNYFKLRDIGELFNFGVDWDGSTNSIIIDTSKGYTLE